MKPIPNLSVVPTVPRDEPTRRMVDIKTQEYLNAALGEGSFELATTSVAGLLARRLACEHVAIGWRQGHSTQVRAWSGNTDIRKEFALVRQVAAAMDECVDQHASLRYPPQHIDPPRITLMQGELVAAGMGGAVCSLPLVVRQQIVGAVTLMRRADRPWATEEMLALEDLLATLAGVLDLKRRSDESAFKRLWQELREFGGKLRGRGNTPTKLVFFSLLIALAAVTLVPVTATVTAEARTEGVIQRSMSAPVDSFIKDVFVRPGDTVRAGAPLVSLSDEELRTEQRRLESELARYQGDYAEAFASQERARMVTAGSRVAETQAGLSLVEQHLARIDIVAPFDGMVVKGDLQQQIGAPVKRGDVLLIMTPGTDFRVVLEVPDRDIDHLRIGMSGRLTVSAMPSESIPLRIERITPIARVVDGNNVFEVQASLSGTHAGLRPGLEGVAKIDLERQPLAQLVGRRVNDWLQFTLWTWLG